MTVTQHQRLLEEAKQGQRVLAMEVDLLKAEVERLTTACNKYSEAELLANKVVLPERRTARVSWHYSDGWNDCLGEVARMNGAKP
jgi:predicted NAD/FAD-binding protein